MSNQEPKLPDEIERVREEIKKILDAMIEQQRWLTSGLAINTTPYIPRILSKVLVKADDQSHPEAKKIVANEVTRQAEFGMEPSWEDFVIAAQQDMLRAGFVKVVKP